MDLLRTLLVYMSVLLAGAAGNSPALTPAPTASLTPIPTATVFVSPTAAPTALPTATATPALSTLASGSRGEEVRRLQNRLIELGYLAAGQADGAFGRRTQMAVERFQSANKLSVDGIAGPKTLNKLYFDPNVVRATPGTDPTAASLSIYYISTTGARLNSETRVLNPGTHTIRPDAAKVPAGYALRSTRDVRVTVDQRGNLNPASVTYTYQPGTSVQTVYVPVYYRSDSNQLLGQDYVAAPWGQATTVFAQPSRVPAGYALITPAELTVSVSSQGVPIPSALTFIYRGPQAVNAVLPVLYRNTQGDLIGSEIRALPQGTHTITADNTKVPAGYTLQSAAQQHVSVSAQGIATPNVLTFTYRTSAVTISLPVRYVDPSGAVLHADSVSVVTGSNIVTANDALVPGYTLQSARQVPVTVDSTGRATPASVSFTYKLPASGQVRILYRDNEGTSLVDTTATLQEGAHTITANDSFVPAGYTLTSARSVQVTVAANGTTTPAQVTFTYQRPSAVTPTPTPTPTTTPAPTNTPEPATDTPAPVSASITVEYHRSDTGALIGGYTVDGLAPGTHVITARDSQVGDYLLQGDASQAVTVDAAGTATPATVVFTFAKPVTATPEPVADTPAPVPEIPALPAYTEVQAAEGSFPVYTGPGDTYYRVGDATLGGGTIRVWGKVGNWALIGYGTSNGGYHVGYVSLAALPADLQPQELTLASAARQNVSTSLFVDDPIVSQNRILEENMAAGTNFRVLGYLNDQWAYVEVDNLLGSGQTARGFVSRSSLGL